MKVQAQEVTTAVDAAELLIKALPRAEKIAVLQRVVGQLHATDLSGLSGELRQTLLRLLPVPPATLALESTKKTYIDSRTEFAPHSAIDFKVALDRQIPTRALLTELLGEEDAALVISDWGNSVDFSKNAPAINKAVLFANSNNKPRNRKYVPGNAKTTQDEDFEAAGLTFADDTQATIVCATLVKKAKDVGLDLSKNASSWSKHQSAAVSHLSAQEIDLLSKLRDGGVRTRSGALYVDVNGRLRANNFFGGFSDAGRWAFGGRASPAE